ncbi:hypothetical protein BGZ76_008041, partial [Entomortierella beljakovae]
ITAQRPQVVQSQQHTMMEDDTADPPSPPAISSDDTDMDASQSGDPPSPASISAPRQDAQTQCETSSDFTVGSNSAHDSFISSLTSDGGRHGNNLPFFIEDHDDPLPQQQQIQLQQSKGGFARQKDVDQVNTLLFDGQAMEC